MGNIKLKTQRKQDKNLKHGFTLIELLLVVVILAFSLTGILAAYVSCFVLSATSKNISIATNEALTRIEEIRSTPYAYITNSPADAMNPGYKSSPDYSFFVNSLPSGVGFINIDDSNPERLIVTVSLCWRQGNRIIGEDTNLNGLLEAWEDIDNDGITDSTVQFSTIIVDRP
ncbi:MAG: prepilin-type N-terminal cleavage/methylation domain-containing protein [Candidatus Omnitrophica bacterium]|nr:prepilin-type N-terminal cleavage/methylation domain-containing protein [Candidatus Omnitrophota bacterium]